MNTIATDNLFEYNNDGIIQFLPLISSHPEIICKNLNEEMNALVKQKISDEKCLSKLSDSASKKPILITLIILQVRLNKEENQMLKNKSIDYIFEMITA